MSKPEDKPQSNEQTVWALYEAKCQQEGKAPSVEDFKVWTTTLLKGLK